MICTTNKNLLKLSSAASLVLGMLFSTTAYTQSADELKLQYEAELRQCESSAVVDKDTCKREAGAAYTEALKGNLTDASVDAASKRCEYLHGDQKSDCIRLMQNQGAQIQGSVESGGVIRSMEYEYTPDINAADSKQESGNSVTESYSID